MWPSRRVLPSKPRYSAGARASSSVTPGAPSSATDVGGRQVRPVRAAWRERRQRLRRPLAGAPLDRPAFGLPGREPAVEDAHVLGAVGPEASTTRARRTGPACRRRPRSWSRHRCRRGPRWPPRGPAMRPGWRPPSGPCRPGPTASRRRRRPGCAQRDGRPRRSRRDASGHRGDGRRDGQGARRATRSWPGSRVGPGRTSSV